MMYPYLTLDDSTEIVHSEMLENNTVKVYLERPDEKDGFHYASCYLPKYEWRDIFGFDDDEIRRYQAFIEDNAHRLFSKNHLKKPAKQDNIYSVPIALMFPAKD